MDIAIIDDDENVCLVLKKKLEQEYLGAQIRTYRSTYDYNDNSNDNLIFLDVMIDNGESFGFGKKLITDKSKTIIYMSLLSDYVFQSIKQDSFYFIRKEYFETDFQAFVSKYNQKNILEIDKSTNYYRFEYNTILWIQAMRNNIIIRTKEGTFEISCSLKEIQAKLNQLVFYRLNRSEIINLQNVTRYDNDYIYLNNNEKIRFTRNSKKGFREAFIAYRGNQVWRY